MKRVILVAHGEGGQGTFSIKKTKTITRANTALTFTKAKEYMDSSKTWPEYASTSFGEFGPLTEAQCRSIFGKTVAGNGIVSTGLRKGGDMAGIPIYVLKGRDDLSRADLETYITTNSITTLILLACRS